jgi:hypothetical protein
MTHTAVRAHIQLAAITSKALAHAGAASQRGKTTHLSKVASFPCTCMGTHGGIRELAAVESPGGFTALASQACACIVLAPPALPCLQFGAFMLAGRWRRALPCCGSPGTGSAANSEKTPYFVVIGLVWTVQ